MIPRIRILPPELAGKIAAGEVVDRPASVIKELIENALDASARSVGVELSGGGMERIQVADDGGGMTREEALLAFERHATSKVKEASDLFSLSTYGFRGEALPSIAAVSRVRLLTCIAQEGAGTELYLEGGTVRQVREAPARVGSLIEVESLFYNTPARRKFLRTPQTELSHVVDTVGQAALCRPEVHFHLTHGKRVLGDYPSASSRWQRLAQLWGAKRAEDLLEWEGAAGAMALQAFVSRPTVSQGSRKDQYLFVNGRPVRQPLLTRAVYEGYDTLLRKGEHPFFVLFLTVDPARLDVNVHPTKREVRFSDQTSVYAFLKASIRDVLLARGHSPFHLPQQGEPTERTASQPMIRIPVPGKGPSDWPRCSTEEAGQSARVREPDGTYADAARALAYEPTVKAIGQVYETFLIVEVNGELTIIDQHTAHERVLYERILQQLQERQLEVQPLLLPQEVILSPADRLRLDQHKKVLHHLGLEIDPSSREGVWVRSVPAVAVDADPQGLLSALLQDVDELGEEAALSERTRTLAATLACHAAVRSGRRLQLSEIEALLGDLLKTEVPHSCPHGRPVLIRFTRENLERDFHRI